MTFVILLIFPAALVVAALSDLATMEIPNGVSIVVAVTFVLAAVSVRLPWIVALTHVGAALVVLGCAFGFFALGYIGGGDAKLVAASTLWFGFADLSSYLLLTAIFGGLLAAIILILRRLPLRGAGPGWTWLDRLRDPAGGIPYGVALSAAALCVYPQSRLWMAGQVG